VVAAARSDFSTLTGSAAVATERRTPADLRKVNIAMDSRCKRRGKGEKKKLNEESS
jgi:hypothetical protein